MLTMTFDTLKTVEMLQEAGMPPAQAKVVSNIVRDSRESAEFVTKSDLRNEISLLQKDMLAMKFELLKWTIGIAMAQIAIVVGVLLKLLP